MTARPPTWASSMIPIDEYIKQANEQRFVIVQIEDPEPLDELEEITAVEGIDMLLFGAGDFSQGIGAPGQWDHPKIIETRKRVAEVARKHGKFAGALGGVDNFKELVDMGYQFISIGADVVGLWQYFRELMSSINGSSVAALDSTYLGKK